MMKRREFLQALVLGGGASLVAGLDGARIGRVLAHAPPGTFAPANGPRDPVTHVIQRLTFGATPELVRHGRRLGAAAFIDEQLNPAAINDSASDAYQERFMLLHNRAGTFLEDVDLADMLGELSGATIARAQLTRRQLQERMVHFWYDHFNVFARVLPEGLFVPDYVQTALRPHALGRFRDLLGAVARHPAMLLYLDNAVSNARQPNENFARELLELHTLGVDGGYTEADVMHVARAFTGWSVTRPDEDRQQAGSFRFRAALHDRGAKTVLGRPLRGVGTREGEMVLDMLAAHPSTARHVAFKLARHFIADDPPAELVDTLAQTYRETDGDITQVLRALFNADAFWQAPPKLRRPFGYTMSIARALDVGIDDNRQQAYYRNVFRMLETMGHQPYFWPAPDGYPDGAAYWRHHLLARWNAALSFVNGFAGAELSFASLRDWLIEAGADGSVEAALAELGRYFYGRELSADEARLVNDFGTSLSDDPADQIRAGIALLITAPAFQYR